MIGERCGAVVYCAWLRPQLIVAAVPLEVGSVPVEGSGTLSNTGTPINQVARTSATWTEYIENRVFMMHFTGVHAVPRRGYGHTEFGRKLRPGGMILCIRVMLHDSRNGGRSGLVI
jgi:hypothetical protein